MFSVRPESFRPMCYSFLSIDCSIGGRHVLYCQWCKRSYIINRRIEHCVPENAVYLTKLPRTRKPSSNSNKFCFDVSDAYRNWFRYGLKQIPYRIKIRILSNVNRYQRHTLWWDGSSAQGAEVSPHWQYLYISFNCNKLVSEDVFTHWNLVYHC